MPFRVCRLVICLNVFLVVHLDADPGKDETAADDDEVSSSGSTSICDVSISDDDVDADVTTLTDCVERWKALLVDYVRAIRRDRRFEICAKYEELRGCVTSYIALCRRHGGDTGLDWMAIFAQLGPVCGGNKSQHSVKMHACLVEEMGGVLSSRCDEYHRFNLKQKTKRECLFLREAIHCRVSLVRSGCDPDAGRLALVLLRFHHRKLSDRLRCRLDDEGHRFKTFTYRSSCDRSFLGDIESCTTRHLSNADVTEFHDDNDLVSTDTEKDFRRACSAYAGFATCLEPINATCSDGIRLFLEYEGNLRRYMLKMGRICQDDVIDGYASSLSCYQSVMSRGQLGQCNVHWSNLRPWLDNITSYQFFCDSSHVNTVNLLLVIQKSHACHRNVFRKECGDNAAEIMVDLMDRALNDPVYLRLGFRPDCQLHAGQPPSENTLSSSSSSTRSPYADTTDDDDNYDDDDDDDDDDEEVYITSDKRHDLAVKTPSVGGRHGDDDGDDDVMMVDGETPPTSPYWTMMAMTTTTTTQQQPEVAKEKWQIASGARHRFDVVGVTKLCFAVHSVLNLATVSTNVFISVLVIIVGKK